MSQTKTVSPIAASNVKPSSIEEYLDRMMADANEIKTRLLEAPASLTGNEEPKLWEIMNRVATDLSTAKRVWG